MDKNDKKLIIYVGHSTNYDYQNMLYKPLLESKLSENVNFILPHYGEKNINSKNIIKESDLFIAEISEPSLGLGIEIGRAESHNKKILFIYNIKKEVSSSIKYVKSDIITYLDEKDMIDKIEKYLKQNFNL